MWEADETTLLTYNKELWFEQYVLKSGNGMEPDYILVQ